MPKLLDLFVIGFGRPDLLREQVRLLRKNLLDKHSITVIDNSVTSVEQRNMEQTCTQLGIGYAGTTVEASHEHIDGLRRAAALADQGCAFWGVLDHDVFPREPVAMIPKIEVAGFYGVTQWHSPTKSQYLWPGFCFFSRKWLGGRVPDFDGIRGIDPRDDGDTGSMLADLFSDDDWARMPRGEHGYGYLREPDGYGLQSFGYEVFDGTWVHLSNSSGWKQIPDRGGRERLVREMLEAL